MEHPQKDMADTPACLKNKSMVDRDKVRGLELNDFEHSPEVQRLYREQQDWIADALAGMYEQVVKHRAEAHRLYKEHPNPATPQGRIAHALAILHEQVAKENYLATQATLEDETEGMVKVSNCLHDNLVKAMRLMWRPFLFIWAVLILLFITYFFVLSKPSVTKVAAPESKSLEKPGQTSEIIARLQVSPTQQTIKSSPIPEWEEVTGILEQIRKAQLKKDINLFINAYSSSFPNIDKKKENILKTWRQYDYLNMHFNVESIQKPNTHTIIARVAWDITLVDVRSKKKSNLLKDYTIHFSDVSGKWFIQELIQGEKTSKVSAMSI